jgi:predicted dehydrogenase
MMAAADRPRLGFLGLGWIGRRRLDAVIAAGAAEIVAVADTSSTAADSAAKAAGAVVAEDLDDLLTRSLDGMVIATPSGLHAGQAVAAFARGLAVFCQKPLACSARDAWRVVDAARGADRLLDLDLSYRHLAAAAAVHRSIRHGHLGQVYAIEATFHNAYGPDKSWALDRGLAGGGCLLDLGVHLVDLALWLLDFPDVAGVTGRTFSRGVSQRAGGDALEDYATARLDLASGATVSIQCSWHLPMSQGAMIRLACYGTQGSALIENVGGSFYDFRASRVRAGVAESLAEPPDDWGGRGIVRWVDRLRQDRRFDPHARRFVDVAAVLDRVYAA